MQSNGMGFGRNSHIPAEKCLECRSRKAKCSKTQPCTTCVRHSRDCVYMSKINRSPLTREHLTAVENRLQLLESTLGRLFPSGDMEAITRALLVDEVPMDQDQSPSAHSFNRDFVNEPPPSDPIALDNDFDFNQSHLETETALHIGAMQQDRVSSAESLLTDVPQEIKIAATFEEENEFINSYFTHYHPLYPILHEATFRSEYKNQTRASPHCPILANIVLAIGAWLTAHTGNSLDKSYFLKARVLFQKVSFADRGDITLIQSLVLLSEFSQKQASPGESGQYIGTAVRIAVAHNLHISPSSFQLNELEKETRRRVWWSVYCSESCAAKIYGRPLLLPEEMLITVEPVSNIHESVRRPNLFSLTCYMLNEASQTLTSSTPFSPAQTDELTVYTSLIEQASYLSIANKIYRRLLSTPSITSQDVNEVQQMLDAWHSNPPCCTPLIDPLTAPEWYPTARCRQILGDQSLRQLIHRPLLLKWMKKKSMETGPSTDEDPTEACCRAQGLNTARNTIGMISESIVNGIYSRWTLSFTLYAFFHALIVPLIHLKADPFSPESISCTQDIKKAELALNHLSIEQDVLSQYLIAVLRRLFSVASQTNKEKSDQTPLSDKHRVINPHTFQSIPHGIFGNEELALLENGVLRPASGLDFSEWVNS